jgi:hypothetical protein
MTMTVRTSRRSLFGGAGLIAVAALAKCGSTPAHAAADHDALIEKHWDARCAAFRGFEGDPLTPDENDRSNFYWDTIEEAEVAILESRSTSLRAAEIRLWVGWSLTNHPRIAGVDLAVRTGDVASLLPIRHRLDWHEKMLFAAILNLRREA